MTITVARLKRAISEVGQLAGNNAEGRALAEIMHSPRVLTMLAERLSDRGGVTITVLDEAPERFAPRTNAILGRNTGEAKRPIRMPLTPKTER